MAVLDQHMAQELETLRKRYHHKRLPILQAMDAKKKQQFRNWNYTVHVRLLYTMQHKTKLF